MNAKAKRLWVRLGLPIGICVCSCLTLNAWSQNGAEAAGGVTIGETGGLEISEAEPPMQVDRPWDFRWRDLGKVPLLRPLAPEVSIQVDRPDLSPQSFAHQVDWAPRVLPIPMPSATIRNSTTLEQTVYLALESPDSLVLRQAEFDVQPGQTISVPLHEGGTSTLCVLTLRGDKRVPFKIPVELGQEIEIVANKTLKQFVLRLAPIKEPIQETRTEKPPAEPNLPTDSEE